MPGRSVVTRQRGGQLPLFSQWFDRITDAIENERKLKKWSRAKKEAFIRGDFAALRQLSAHRSPDSAKRSGATDSSD
jgi:putative endonuclease